MNRKEGGRQDGVATAKMTDFKFFMMVSFSAASPFALPVHSLLAVLLQRCF